MSTKPTMLSAHFSADELRCDATGECLVTGELLVALEELRAAVSLKLKKDTPLKVLSGYRSPKHNAEVGGAAKSEHTTGRAADLATPAGLTTVEFFKLAEGIAAFNSGGVGIYDGNFIHVDVRKKKARWARIAGAYVGVEVGLQTLAKSKARGTS